MERQELYLAQVSSHIPKECYTQVIDVKGDGFCGFRALAYQVYGSENEVWRVKRDMRDTLIKNIAHYKDHYWEFMDADALKALVSYGIGDGLGDNVYPFIETQFSTKGILVHLSRLFSAGSRHVPSSTGRIYRSKLR